MRGLVKKRIKEQYFDGNPFRYIVKAHVTSLITDKHSLVYT